MKNKTPGLVGILALLFGCIASLYNLYMTQQAKDKMESSYIKLLESSESEDSMNKLKSCIDSLYELQGTCKCPNKKDETNN